MARSSRARARAAASGRPCTSAGSSTLSITVRQGSRIGFWNTMPMSRARRRHQRFRRPRSLPALARQQAGDQLEQRALAATARAHDGDEFALADRERYVVERVNPLVADRDEQLFDPGHLDHGGGGPQRGRACGALHVHAVLPDMTCRMTRRCPAGRLPAGASKAVRRRAFNRPCGRMARIRSCENEGGPLVASGPRRWPQFVAMSLSFGHAR